MCVYMYVRTYICVYVCVCICIYICMYMQWNISQPGKRMKYCYLPQHGWTLGTIILSEVSQTEKDK